jgi:hypothetical protein
MLGPLGVLLGPLGRAGGGRQRAQSTRSIQLAADGYLDFQPLLSQFGAGSSIFDVGTGAFTLCAWVKSSAFGTGKMVLGKDNIDGGGSGFFWTTSGDVLYCYPLGFEDSGTTVPSDGAWHFVVQGRSGTGADQAFGYIDNVLKSTGTDSRTLASVRHFTAGIDGDFATGTRATCLLDDIRFYTAALTAQQIADLYAGFEVADGLAGHWALDEGTGTTLDDSAGSLDGALTGGAWSTDVPTPLQ